MAEKIINHQQLKVYQKSFEAAMQLFELSKSFPKDNTFAKNKLSKKGFSGKVEVF